MKLEIEKGVPLARAKYPFNEMEVGDSFLVPSAKKSSQLGSSIAVRRHRYGEEYKCRKEEGGLRVWRVR